MKPHPKLQQVVDVVLKTVLTEKIALLAYINKDRETWSIFEDKPLDFCNPAKLNILIIARVGKSSIHEKLDMIDQRCKYKSPVAGMIMTPDDFNVLLDKGSPFAVTVVRSGHWLYERHKITGAPDPINKPVFELKTQEREISCWYKHGMSFLSMAGSQYSFGEFGMAAFCLHQAAEQFLNMLTQALTGLRVGTHNLDRLLSILRFYNKEIPDVFTRRTEQEKNRFALLKSTYISFRYRTDFEVGGDDVDYLMNEVIKLKAIAEKVFRGKIANTQYQLLCAKE